MACPHCLYDVDMTEYSRDAVGEASAPEDVGTPAWQDHIATQLQTSLQKSKPCETRVSHVQQSHFLVEPCALAFLPIITLPKYNSTCHAWFALTLCVCVCLCTVGYGEHAVLGSQILLSAAKMVGIFAVTDQVNYI
jgi:hypothetical protein